MREPGFWYGSPSPLSWLLWPVAKIYGAITARRMARSGMSAGIPVFCIGNYHVGGAGKTPATLALAKILSDMGERPFVVSRGYGGSMHGPVRVDEHRHAASDVGDEPLMMASHLPVVVSRDRVAGATLARGEGASVILLDDGFQNPALDKDASLIVIDGTRALGNGLVFPSGPLRAPLPPQLARTDALIVIGQGRAAADVADKVTARGGLVLRAVLVPDHRSLQRLQGQRVLAFAGIGDPARFFATLRACGVDVVDERIFADHHPFLSGEMEALASDAAAQSLILITTEKDFVRIASDPMLEGWSDIIVPFAVTLEIGNEPALRGFLADRFAKARGYETF
ncbi:MAG: tetraacyldisaccharide 4'-kinase [Xanthobacteraceae bacterium]|nr:tetraacyldisaccharide 4'-kinase [Xanthobacteraceae bacterium]